MKKILSHALLLTAVWTLTLSFAAAGIVPLGPYGGDVRSLAVHPKRPDRFFLGTSDGQIYVSNNAGGDWQLIWPGLGRRDLVIDNLVFDPRNPDVLFAGTWELKNNSGGLYRSSDGGQTWNNVPLGSFTSAVRAAAIAPSDPDVIALGISEGVILSSDAGKTWDRITRGYRSLYNVESLAFDPKDSETLYVGTWHLGFKTVNRGKKWEPIHAGMIDDSDMFSLLVNPDQPDVLYASACTGIYRSGNAGESWQKLRNGLPKDANRTRTLLIDPVDSSRIYAGTTVGLFVSPDAGTSWARLVPNVVVNSISVQPGNAQFILVGTDDAGVLKSTDGGATFESANKGFIHRQISALAVARDNPSLYYSAVALDRQFGGFFYSPDRGHEWRAWNEGLDDVVSGITCILAESDKIYLGTNDGAFVGVPGEQPWERLPLTRGMRVTEMSFGPMETLFLATGSGLHELDIQAKRIRRAAFPAYKGSIKTILFCTQTGKLFAGGETGVFRSDDGGQSWTMKVRGLPYSSIHSLSSSGTRLFSGTPKGLFYSDDQGESWNAAKGIFPLDIMTVQSNPLRRSEVFAADLLVGYIFRSIDGGTSWQVMNQQKTRSRIAQLVFSSSGDLLAGTLSEGVYLIPLEDSAQAATD